MKHSSLANRIDHTREEEETAATPLLRAALVALSVRAGISLLNSVSQQAHVVVSFLWDRRFRRTLTQSCYVVEEQLRKHSSVEA